MYFEFIYQLGQSFTFFPKVDSLDERFKLISFPYKSAAILSGIAIYFLAFVLISMVFWFFFPLGSYIFFFFGVILAVGAYIYATSIFFTQSVIAFRDEMLQTILELANYVSLNTSMEAAIFYISETASGTLGIQLREIRQKMEKKEYITLGDAFERYIPLWLQINPEFVKGLNLLQTAAMSTPDVREEIINEVVETVIQYYYESGKKFTETLSNKTKTLISIGVMLPMMSLILLPLITIFLPKFLDATILFFIYDIFFPMLLLVFAFDFATNRLQVNTVNITHSPEYKKTPWIFFVLAGLIALFLAIPAFWHLSTIDLSSQTSIAREYSLGGLINVWFAVLGLFFAAWLLSFFYYNQHEKLWKKAKEIEEDIPHFLSILASYLSLNRSLESALVDIQDDYKRHGFPKHPSIIMLENIRLTIERTKMTLKDIIDKKILSLTPSLRMVQTLKKIVLFTDIDQKNAAKSARMIRNQTISVYKLDSYIQTLLVETSSLVDITVTVMAPLLAVAATIMALAIVMSLEFIKQQITSILQSVGGQTMSINLQLVDMTSIIPPTILAIIVGIYLMETVTILSIFLSNINFGTDRVQIARTLSKNLMVSFILYSGLLFISYYMFTELLFRGVISS
ncbi:MAG: hypothetical protein V1777_04050 [Candidatus Micrarchaeota archaeon]